MATRRSEVVTLEGLTASLDKAFAIASKRHGAVFDEGTLALGWGIFGRRIRSVEKAGVTRLDVANSVIASARLKNVNPAVIGLGKWTLVGYWNPEGGPLGPIGPRGPVGPSR